MLSLSKHYTPLPVLVTLAASAFAQTMGTGTITGTVSDATGAVVAGGEDFRHQLEHGH